MHTAAIGSIGVTIPTALPVWQTGVVSRLLFITLECHLLSAGM